MTQITKHFTMESFTSSDTAARQGIDNSLPPGLQGAARDTCELLERIRSKLFDLAGHEVPVIVTSGYRCLAVNRAIGSCDASDHVKALAADIKAPAFGTPLEIARALAPLVGELGIGQLIYEFSSWVHVSTRQPEKQVNRIITIDQSGTHVGVVE